jgi:hypothetical protein
MYVHRQYGKLVIQGEHCWVAATRSSPVRPFTYPSLTEQLIGDFGHSAALKT